MNYRPILPKGATAPQKFYENFYLEKKSDKKLPESARIVVYPKDPQKVVQTVLPTNMLYKNEESELSYMNVNTPNTFVTNPDPLKVEISEGSKPIFEGSNPWLVEDVSIFLKYNCPECNYNHKDLKAFSNHALENHENSTALFSRNNLLDIKAEPSDNYDYEPMEYAENVYDDTETKYDNPEVHVKMENDGGQHDYRIYSNKSQP